MGGTTMWIILGGLIGLVVIFLIVTSVLDKKKTKKIQIEKKELNEKISVSGEKISKEIMKVVRANERSLANFVPSVGKKKMSDINNEAKNKLIEIRNSRDFRLVKHNEKEENLFKTNIDALIKEKSNNWNKRNQPNIDFFANYKKPEPEKKETKKNKSEKKDKKSKKVKSDKSQNSKNKKLKNDKNKTPTRKNKKGIK